MGVILTATVALVIWLVLWAIGVASGFDSILIGVAMVLFALAIRTVLPYLPGRRG